MVADPQDSQRVTSTFRLKYSGEDDDGKWREYEKELIFRHDAPKKRRRTVEETNQKERRELDSMREELEAMKSSLHQDRRQMGGLHHCTACQSKDEDYDREVGKHHCERKLRTGAESSLAEAAEQLSDQGMLVQKLTNEIGLLEKQLKRSSDQAAQSAGAVKRQMAKALEARAREREMRANTVNLETFEGVVEQLKLAKELELETKSAAEHLGWEKEDLEEKLEEKKAELAKATDSRPGRGRHAELQATKKMTELKVDTGVRSMYTSVPARVAENMNAEQLSVRHMAAVLNGRGEGENINLVADALHRAGYLERLIDNADRVQPLLKGMVKEAVTKTQTHWTARHAVHVWDRLELSRSQMETLRHLLSHVYDAATNTYVPIKAWVNPKDDSDFVLTATLAGRWAREKEFERLASKMNIVVGATDAASATPLSAPPCSTPTSSTRCAPTSRPTAPRSPSCFSTARVAPSAAASATARWDALTSLLWAMPTRSSRVRRSSRSSCTRATTTPARCALTSTSPSRRTTRLVLCPPEPPVTLSRPPP